MNQKNDKSQISISFSLCFRNEKEIFNGLARLMAKDYTKLMLFLNECTQISNVTLTIKSEKLFMVDESAKVFAYDNYEDIVELFNHESIAKNDYTKWKKKTDAIWKKINQEENV